MFACWFWLHLGLELRKFRAIVLEVSEFPAVKTLFVLRLALRAFAPMTLPPTSIAHYSRPVWLYVSRWTSSASSRCVLTLGARNRIHWVWRIVIIDCLLLPSSPNVMSPHLYWLANGSARVRNTVNILTHSGRNLYQQKTLDIHHGSTPNAKLACHMKTHMLYARCNMTIYGNITFHACLELVTSQDWRHNITVTRQKEPVSQICVVVPFSNFGNWITFGPLQIWCLFYNWTTFLITVHILAVVIILLHIRK